MAILSETVPPEISSKREPLREDPSPRQLPRSLRANFLWTITGQLLFAACQWGMLVVLAKMGDAEMVGQFALALAITAPILMFTNLDLRGIQATDARGEYSFAEYLGLRISMTAVALAIIIGFAFVLGGSLEIALAVTLIGIAKALDAIGDSFHGYLQKHERMDRLAISLVLKGALSLVVLGGVIYVTHNILYGALALAVSSLLVLVFYDRRSVARTQQEQNVRHDGLRLEAMLRLARLAFPLGLVMCIISLTTNIPRYFVEQYHGLHALGIFAATYYLTVVGARAITALGDAVSPRLAKHYARGERGQFLIEAARLSAFAAILGIGMILLALFFGRELLTVFYRAEYAASASVFVSVAIAEAIGYLASSLTYPMRAARFFFIQTPLFGLSALVTAGACAVLVPEQGLSGAASSVAIGVTVQLVGSLAIVVYALVQCCAGKESV